MTAHGVLIRADAGGLPSMPSDGERTWEPEPGARLAPALLPLHELKALADPGPVFLGVREDGAALFAVDVEDEDAPRSDDTGIVGVREAAARLDPADAGLVAYATALLNWHRRHRFCANSGHASHSTQGGHARACPGCGAEHYPRTDPVVIMLVLDGEDRVLLGRQAAWPPGRYSALAGFVEPGESLEAAVEREVLEESGVRATGARYVSSQPWPFPASLMLGFVARSAGGEARAADDELQDARWFTRDEVAAAAGGRGELKLPPALAIARRLLDGWLAGELPA
ncbi:MAG TPA: NAD(+) diphosphatase [Solirubrobacteraceae bacterium]